MGKDWTGNKNSIFKTLGSSTHAKGVRQAEDYYATPPQAIDRLIAHYKLPSYIWECAAGEGHLAKRLMDLGYNVFCTDIVDRGFDIVKRDFLKTNDTPFINNYCILTNPPYKYATEFIEHALEIIHYNQPVIMLLKTPALAGLDRFNRLYSKGYLEAIYQFTTRITCAKNGEFETYHKGGGSAVDYFWGVFRKNAAQPPKIYWV